MTSSYVCDNVSKVTATAGIASWQAIPAVARALVPRIFRHFYVVLEMTKLPEI